jgi:hypothetical protein
MSKWTRARLLNELLRRLADRKTTIAHASFPAYSHSASCEYERKGKGVEVAIQVDSAQDGAVTMIVHELLHTMLDDQLEAFLSDELAEYAIAGIEERLVRWLTLHPRQYERWRKAIIRKVEAD